MPIQDFLPAQIFAILMVFCRIGGAMMLIPGIGETYIPAQMRLILALGLSLVVAPLVAGTIVAPASAAGVVRLIAFELIIGLYLGVVARILLLTLDTAGRIISFSIGLANAEVFNPQIATQGSLPGFFLLTIGTLLLLIADMHHLMIRALIDSYTMFPAGNALPLGDFSEAISRLASESFRVALQLSAPFLVLSFLFYLGLGVMARLMPQLQIFFVGLPIQVLMGVFILSAVLSGALALFLEYYADGVGRYIAPA